MKKKPEVNYSHFSQLDIRLGTVRDAKYFKEANTPAILMKIDFGKLGILKSSAQLTHNYSPTQLIGKQVVAVVNFPPKQIANAMSECLVLGGVDSDGRVTLLRPDREVPEGLPIG